jgi:ankyrin repeat protein
MVVEGPKVAYGDLIKHIRMAIDCDDYWKLCLYLETSLPKEVLSGSIDSKLPLIHLAVLQDRPFALKEIIRQPLIDLNQVERQLGMTALHLAVVLGRLELVQILLQAGVKVNVADRCLRTPLHHAIRFSNIVLIDLLLRSGASTSQTDSLGKSAIDLIRESQNLSNLFRL